MPTTRPRHPITETDEIAGVLEQAELRWGPLPRTRLIQLILLDWANGGTSPRSQTAARRNIIGSLPGSSELYDRDADWPA